MTLKREHLLYIAVVGAAVLGVLLLTRRKGESGAVTIQTVAPSEATARSMIEASTAFADIESQRQLGLAEIFTGGTVAIANINAEERTQARQISASQSITEILASLEKYRIAASERVAIRELEGQHQKNLFDFVVDIFSSVGSVFK